MAVCGRNGSILVERYAYVLFFAPDDVARNAHAVCLEYQREILRDFDDGADHVEGRPEIDMLLTTLSPPNAIVPDINTGLRGFARLSINAPLAKSRRRVEIGDRLRTPRAWYAARAYVRTMP